MKIDEKMKHRAEWLYERKWGVMVHYLADLPSCLDPVDLSPEEWNRRVDKFDVKNFVKQLSEIKCGWLIFSIGQNSGFYCSPNETYDEIVKRKPSRLSKRDLIKDLGEELGEKDIRLITYLPSQAPLNDIYALEKLKCTPIWKGPKWGLRDDQYKVQEGVDERLTDFQIYWESIIREWSKRWGKLVSGWWFDGCYYSDKMYNFPDEPNFKSFAESARSGNLDSIVAFNPGVKVPIISLTEYEDYTAGEIAGALPVNGIEPCVIPLGRFIKNAQYHILTFIGGCWARGSPRFTDEFLISYTKHINSFGGAITYDFPPPSEDGNIPLSFFNQLKKLSLQIN
ncbi:MAG: hypothetical protein NC824_05535 [Candidatus Omnitrophica bacterium]|nr:hypothetical protein [Candidatus Omnitrophota bacterium]